ncbi:armadillo repeat-containing protein 2 [Glossina fuscipes fuscipes]
MRKIYLNKRRSQSETRQNDIIGIDEKRSIQQLAKVRYGQQKLPLSNVTTDLTIENLNRRRTSAEMISEAKMFLNEIESSTNSNSNSNSNNTSNSNINMNANRALANVIGVKVISTRRPTTPRDTARVLYGKVSLDGRPPSAFSLRYLQNENIRNLTKTPPVLEPLAINQEKSNDEKLIKPKQTIGGHRRSQSYDEETCDANVSKQVQGKSLLNRKLPALEVKGLPAPLLDSRERDRARERERAKTAYNESNNLISNDSVTTLLTARKLLTRSNDLLAQSSAEKLIDMLKEHAGLKECTAETVNHINSILLELYQRLHKNEKSFKKGFILGGLYGLVECTSPKILLAVARVVLALRVSGSNLTGACKLIFKVARNEQNDQLFYDNDILELLVDGLGRASPLEDPEACIYGYGSIRFLTCSSGQERAELSALKDINRNWFEQLELPRKPATAPALGDMHKMEGEFKQKLNKQDALVIRLARHGAVQLMILHLQMLNEAGAMQKLSGPPLHSLYQLSAALRAFADIRQYSSSLEKLETYQTESAQYGRNNIQLELACPHLIKAAEITIGEIEVQNNVVRTLSVLSEDVDCCQILMSFSARLGMLLGSCCAAHVNGSANEKLLSLISRLGYILGNIMAKYDSARVQFYHNDVAMEYLINILEIYAKEPLTLHNSMGDSVIDVLIKIIRVVANMSVNEEVGLGLGNCRSLGNILLELIKVNQEVKSIKLKQELQELFHATLGALHNLCFYQDKNIATPDLVMDSQGSLQSILPELTSDLCKSLKLCRDEMLQVEIARVLGNLTRNEKARKQFSAAQGLPVILQILNSPVNNEIYDLKACTIGILVNVLGDIENRKPFFDLKGPQILLVLLRHVTMQQAADWFLATIIYQAFWNLFIDTQHIEELCSSSILDELSDMLIDHLDEEKFAKTSTDDLPADVWENFALVATDLLERLQTNYDQLNGGSMLSLTNTNDYDNDEMDVYIERI